MFQLGLCHGASSGHAEWCGGGAKEGTWGAYVRASPAPALAVCIHRMLTCSNLWRDLTDRPVRLVGGLRLPLAKRCLWIRPPLHVPTFKPSHTPTRQGSAGRGPPTSSGAGPARPSRNGGHHHTREKLGHGLQSITFSTLLSGFRLLTSFPDSPLHYRPPPSLLLLFLLSFSSAVHHVCPDQSRQPAH